MSASQPPVPPLLVDDNNESGPTRAVWLLLLSLGIAKITLVVAVLVIDFSAMSSLLLFLTSWLWVIFGAVLIAGPLSFAIRLRKVKSRKRALERSEWMLDDKDDSSPEQTGTFPSMFSR